MDEVNEINLKILSQIKDISSLEVDNVKMTKLSL